MFGEPSAYDLVTQGDGFVYLENRGNGRDEACWIGYVTPEGVMIRYGKIGKGLRTQTVPNGICLNGSPREELVNRVMDKLKNGYKPAESNATSDKVKREFEKANRKDLLEEVAEANIPAGEAPVYWTIRAESLSDSMRKMAQEYMHQHAAGHAATAILDKSPIEARGSGLGIMESEQTLVLAVLADRLPAGAIALADDDGKSITLDILRSEDWVSKKFEDLAVDLGIIKRPIQWGQVHHPASVEGWF